MSHEAGSPPAALRLAVVADASPFNDWLLPRIGDAVPIALRIRPDWSDVTSTPRPANRTRPEMSQLRRQLRSVWYAGADRRHAAALAQALHLLGPATALETETVSIPSRQLNDETVLSLLRDARPDVLLVSGAPILSPALCMIATLGTFNVHLGITPRYRGMHTLLVPWQQGDWRHLGATVHHVKERVDAGSVMVRVYPELRRTDTLAEVEARLAPLLATELVLLLKALGSAEIPTRPDGRRFPFEGAAIRYHDRRIIDNLRHRTLSVLGRRPLPQEARVERFYGTPASLLSPYR